MAFAREVPISVWYRGEIVGSYRADFVVAESIILELKAGRSLDDSARWQTLNYLRATGVKLGLVLHFGRTPAFRSVVF